MYMDGNFICAPSMCINREVYEKVAPFRYQYRQLQDYEFWLRLLQVSNFYVMPEKLVAYRVHPEGENHNISKMNPDTRLRDKMERKYIMLSIMEELDDDFFLRAFADNLIRHPGEEGFCVECEKFSVMLNSKFVHPESAILYFYHHYNDERFQACAEKYYGITRRALWDFAAGDYDGTIRYEQVVGKMQGIIARLQKALEEKKAE